MSNEAPQRRRGSAAASQRVPAPFGRRSCRVAANAETGGYRIVSAVDPAGPMPRPGQFYMLAAESWGGATGRPYLPRAFSVAEAEDLNKAPEHSAPQRRRTSALPSGLRDRRRRGSADASQEGVRLDFLLEAIGPGTERLADLGPGDALHLTGPLGRPFSSPEELAPGTDGAILVGGGIGIAPLALLRRELAEHGVPQRVLLGFRDRAHSGGLELFRCSEVRTASEDGHTGHQGYVTDLLAVMLEGDAATGAAVYACGPPAMLEAVRAMCAEREVVVELAMEAPMACGFGSCFGCAVPLRAGGYMRLCVDGPTVPAELIETALVAGSGHR